MGIVNDKCFCKFNESNVLNRMFSCRSTENTTTMFRAEITYQPSRLMPYSADDLVQFISDWVQSGASIVVDGTRLNVNSTCPNATKFNSSANCVNEEQAGCSNSSANCVNEEQAGCSTKMNSSANCVNEGCSTKMNSSANCVNEEQAGCSTKMNSSTNCVNEEQNDNTDTKIDLLDFKYFLAGALGMVIVITCIVVIVISAVCRRKMKLSK